jgi:ubiquinone/menaquinone biosynthesis C-methylase UbiE
MGKGSLGAWLIRGSNQERHRTLGCGMKPEVAPYRSAAKYFGANATNYEEIRTREERWQLEQEIVKSYVKTIPVGSKIADVPFGTGRFAPFYIERHLNVFGADISDDMLGVARKNIGEAPGFELRVAAAEALPLADRSVDYLICHRFIKWLPDTQALIKVMTEFARVTRKEIFVQVRLEPKPGALARIRKFFRKNRKKKAASIDDRIRTSKFTARDIRRAIRAAGLSIAHTEPHPEVSKGVVYYTLKQR